MSRWTGSWLEGPDSVLEPGEGANDGRQQRWRGERHGFPEKGPGSIASIGRRTAAILVDFLLSAGVAAVFTRPELPQNWSLLSWFVITVVAVAFFGFTPGHALLGLRVARIDGKPYVHLPRALLRTILIFPLIPALVWDSDGRCLHDKAAGTVVVKVR